MEIERRFVAINSAAGALRVKLRHGTSPIFRGYAARFNTLSENLGGFREMLAPGCFDNALTRVGLGAGGGVLALFNHSNDHVLGRSTSGTLRLAADDEGLGVEIDPPDTQLGRDLSVLVQRGDITGMSFAFTVEPQGESYRKDADGMTIRTVTKVDTLYDVSVVTVPAYSASSVSMRSPTAWKRDAQPRRISHRAALARATAAAAKLRGYCRSR